MKIAIAIHGNLRTFFMPLRDGSSRKLCDNFTDNVIRPTAGSEVDYYISTDVNDFFYGDTLYYSDDRKIEITNGNSFRLYEKIDFLSKNDAEELIRKSLSDFFPNIKGMRVSRGFDASSTDQFKILEKSDRKGASPGFLVSQYSKIMDLHDMIKESEEIYDVILRVRFDSFYESPFNLNHKDYTKNIYVPGSKDRISFDWYMFGNHSNMMNFLSLYERIGITLEDPAWLVECPRCRPITVSDSEDKSKCRFCGGPIAHSSDITISSEYHIGKNCEILGISPQYGGVGMSIYRYYASDSDKNLKEILSSDNLKGSVFVNHTTGRDKSEEIL
jgi:hypothetical protein